MPANSGLTITAGRFEGIKVRPSDVRVNWENNKSRAFPYTPEDVADLIQDFQDGREIRNPLIGRKVDGVPELLAGYRRLYAGLLWEKGNEGLGVEPHPDFQVPMVFRSPKTSLDALIENARENIARKDLSPIDLGHLIVAFDAENLTNAEIARQVGGPKPVSEAQITQHRKLVTELPEFIQSLIHRRTLTADDAFTLLKVDPEKRISVLNEHLASKGILNTPQEGGSEPAGGVDETFIEERPTDSTESSGETPSAPSSKPRSLREIAVDAGADVGSKRMPEFKKYLNEAIETDGPGSNKGEVALKKEILKFLEGKLTSKQMDNKFDKYCKATS